MLFVPALHALSHLCHAGVDDPEEWVEGDEKHCHVQVEEEIDGIKTPVLHPVEIAASPWLWKDVVLQESKGREIAFTVVQRIDTEAPEKDR